MSTILVRPENLGAMMTLPRTARKQVDDLMKLEDDIYVWLDSGCYGNSIGKGYYYVRRHDPRTWLSTAYDAPFLIVKKSKLRPDQIEFMERKCIETSDRLLQN